nr:ribonuclease H-like domain-containing protein [Tanacetum cinerariifolium]
ATSASPMILLAKSNSSARRDPSLEKSTLLPRTSGSASSVSDVTRSDLEMLQSLLAKFGLNAPNTSTPSPSVAYTVSVPPRFPSVSAQLSAQPTYGVHLVPGPSQPPVQFTTGVQQQQGGSFPGLVHLGQSPSMPFHPSQLFASGSQGSGQATLLSNAFNTTTLQDPASDNWNMDTCASSHLNDSVHCLSDILNMCIYPSVAVGDGRLIPVTNSGHNVLSTPFRPLRLNNVLITPNIVKNLIFVRQFVRDSYCTVEFDPFGFSVKDFITRRVLLRCDSTGDLYPVMKPSTIPLAFLTSQYTWHQRLRHPGSEVLRRLVSSDSISCNKEKFLVLCHACQLGKHVKLSFVSSSSFVTSCFDIVHSDLWTSPIPSLSGFQYYVLFLDHYSQYVWVYSLMNKYDVLSKFMLFRNYVRTRFKCEIKSFQCDHGGELDNHAFHKLFHDNAPVHTPQVDVPTSPTPPTPPPPHTSQSVPQIVPEHVPAPTNDSPTVSIHPMVTRSRVGTTRPNPRYAGHVSTISPLPRSYKEAFNDPNWKNAMFDEYNALIKNKTWTRPEGANIARLVANGSTQVEGVDVDETFSPVVKPGTIRTVLSLAISRHWPVHQLDVKNAFLHGDLAETVYMHQPLGFQDLEHPNYVCLLQRSLYGLEQAPRAWFQLFAAYITTVRFTPSRCDFSLFIYKQGDDTAFLLLYVDDIVLTASSDRLLHQIIASLHREFSMTDLGALNYFLGISVTRDSSGIFLAQRKYDMEILERAHMVGCNPSWTPVDTESKLGDGGTPVVDPILYRSLAGSLQYLTFTRPDIAYAVQQVCLYMHDPREPYFSALKRILRYVQGTLDYGLHLFSSTTDSLIAYSDADWAGCPTTRRSTSGYCVFLGNNLLSWSSKRQPTLSRSSAKAEYRGVANAVAETC